MSRSSTELDVAVTTLRVPQLQTLSQGGNRGAEADQMMKKKESSGERIRKLRDSRHETQSEFAKLIGVKRAAVSAWEKDDKLRSPSAIVYFKLAELARSPEDAKWFLGKAHIKDHLVFSLAEKLGKGRTEPPAVGETVTVGPLAGSADIGELILDRGRVPNPNFTYYFVADERTSELILPPGIVVVDTKEGGRLLNPFWGKLVLARIAPGAEQVPAGTPEYVLGKVWCSRPGGSLHSHFTRDAILAGVGEPGRFDGITIGFLQHEEYGPRSFILKTARDHAFYDKAAKKVHERAHFEMETHPEIEIVGRVRAWFALDEMLSEAGALEPQRYKPVFRLDGGEP